MLFRLDTASPVALGDQIAASVRGAIAEGRAGAGERLPSAKELAASLGVNVHTVLRGYQQLRDEGLIELRRGRGAVVTGVQPEARARLAADIRVLVEDGRELGLTDEQLLALVRSALGDD
ncbi:GntR family transcriptional regulator [Streptomyces lonarensis]|uniref:GntR family transcriptional regulator n=1 Tax=Streptomyces lonarensis TaxID=700599 RepID=A0A7X6HY24_9ACTN|nr:GntR family transcriptional regulator [Streptomyces lonarensis]NJQ04950.1 GntR family transcriptional regulator [Streptomyces lonarensis]